MSADLELALDGGLFERARLPFRPTTVPQVFKASQGRTACSPFA
jgi:hypothetical protein